MPLFLSPLAYQDIAEIEQYVVDRSPQGLQKILDALKQTLQSIEAHPQIGRAVRGPSVRVYKQAKYNFLVPYALRGDEIWVLRIYHARRYPLNFSELDLPVM